MPYYDNGGDESNTGVFSWLALVLGLSFFYYDENEFHVIVSFSQINITLIL
jgi:hypothetical protein